jgi:hypothetical protein
MTRDETGSNLNGAVAERAGTAPDAEGTTTLGGVPVPLIILTAWALGTLLANRPS